MKVRGVKALFPVAIINQLTLSKQFLIFSFYFFHFELQVNVKNKLSHTEL